MRATGRTAPSRFRSAKPANIIQRLIRQGGLMTHREGRPLPEDLMGAGVAGVELALAVAGARNQGAGQRRSTTGA